MRVDIVFDESRIRKNVSESENGKALFQLKNEV
jgi:hypothetical protein